MAGRPLSRLRTATRNNPLVDWDNQYKGTPGSVSPEYAVMLQKNAEEKFRAAFAQSDRALKAKGLPPFRLSVIIMGETETMESCQKRASALGRATKSLVAIQVVAVSRAAAEMYPPGDSGRITPFTPFNFFHRLEHSLGGDAMKTKVDPRAGRFFDGNIEELSFVPRPVQLNYQLALERAEELAEQIRTSGLPASVKTAAVRRLFN